MTDPRHRSELITAPAGLADPLLWRLAIDVATAHQTDTEGHCTNLQCARWQHGECPPARLARYALRRAYPTPSLRPLPALITRTGGTPAAARPLTAPAEAPTSRTSWTAGHPASTPTPAPLPRPRPHPVASAA